MSDALLKWAETIGYTPFVCHILNLFDRRVHDDEFCCRWVSPYGFVPEEGCPKHDYRSHAAADALEAEKGEE